MTFWNVPCWHVLFFVGTILFFQLFGFLVCFGQLNSKSHTLTYYIIDADCSAHVCEHTHIPVYMCKHMLENNWSLFFIFYHF